MTASNHPSLSKTPALGGQNLRNRLLLTVLPAVLLPLFLADLVAYQLFQRRAFEEARQKIGNESALASYTVSEFLSEIEDIVRTFSQSPVIIDAARDAARRVESEGLDRLNQEQLEQRFAQTKQLFPVDSTVGTYLKRIEENTDLFEIFFTERRGLTVAHGSKLSIDFVQEDDAWWQTTKMQGEWLESDPQSDEDSRQLLYLEGARSIEDPESGEFLGVIQIERSLSELKDSIGILTREILDETGRIQTIHLPEQTTEEGRAVEVILTVSQEEVVEGNIPIVGGQKVVEVGTYIVHSIGRGDRESASAASEEEKLVWSQVQPADLEQLEETLQRQFDLKDIRARLLGSDRNPDRIAVYFRYQGKIFDIVTIPDTDWIAVTSIEIEEVLTVARNLNLVFLTIAAVLGIIASGITLLLARQLAQPLVNLSESARQVAAGNLDERAPVKGTSETRLLAKNFNDLVAQVKDLLARQQQETDRAERLAAIAQVQQEKELSEPLSEYLAELRENLQADRVVVYRFHADGSGLVVGESVAPEPQAIAGETIESVALSSAAREYYERDDVWIAPHVQVEDSTSARAQLLARWEVKALLGIPILVGGELFGVLEIHQCSDRRDWPASAVASGKDTASRLSLALSSLVFLEKQVALAREQQEQRETLEREVFALITDLEGAAEGDLTVRTQMQASDIGIIADLFNAIIDNLRDTAMQVKQSSVQVSQALGANESSILELAESATLEAEETRGTLGSIEEMTHSIQGVAGTAEQAAAIAERASSSARQGNEVMTTTVESIQNLRVTVSDTAKKMKRLGESAQRISQVVAAIEEISLKTNLLAINAAVEADRAGELGQGFSAVAEQVGELAAQASSATEEIALVVESIQTETQEVVAAMEEGTAKVVDSTRLVETTQHQLGDVVQTAQEIDRLMKSISQATVSQARTSQTVTELVRKLARASEERSLASRRVAEAIQGTAGIARTLETSVARFKIDDSTSFNGAASAANPAIEQPARRV